MDREFTRSQSFLLLLVGTIAVGLYITGKTEGYPSFDKFANGIYMAVIVLTVIGLIGTFADILFLMRSPSQREKMRKRAEQERKLYY